ncbi:hypothetical protein DL765_010477 [Monosporascus sp. GIB2]|nr:hypothetical protein DL765_010477 [Monosporascus sp. GIB2]
MTEQNYGTSGPGNHARRTRKGSQNRFGGDAGVCQVLTVSKMGMVEHNRSTPSALPEEKTEARRQDDETVEDNAPPESAASGTGAEETDDFKPGLSLSKTRAIALVATVTGASFLNSVVIILPQIGEDLGIPESRLQWVVSGYALTFGEFLSRSQAGTCTAILIHNPFSQHISCALALVANDVLDFKNPFEVLDASKGAAANVPTAIGILGTTFPPGKAKNYAFSAYGAPLGSVFGNLIAGIIASYANWRWVFGATGGLAIAVTTAGIFCIPPPPPGAVSSKKSTASLLKDIDWIGGFLVTAGLLAFMFALTQGNVVGWSTVWIYMLIVIAVLLFGIFVAWQWYQERHTTRAPLMKVSMFKNRRFSTALVIMGTFFGYFNDFIVLATFFWQDFQGLSALQTTLRFIPTGATGFIVAFIMSHLVSRLPTWMLLLFGNFTASMSCLLFSIPIPPDTSYFAFGFPAMILSVIGADIAWPCLTLFTSKSLPQADQAMGGALINAMGQIGRSIGLAITTAIQTGVMASQRGLPVEQSGGIEAWEPASLAGLRAGNWFNFGLGVFSMALVAISFRGTGIVGKIEKHVRSDGEEGIMNERGSSRGS